MTTFRVFAARRAGAGFHPRRWLVIGSIVAVGWNAAGVPWLTMRQAAGSMNSRIPRQGALLENRRSSPASWRWWDERSIALDVGKDAAKRAATIAIHNVKPSAKIEQG
jgi:hypothetical protein